MSRRFFAALAGAPKKFAALSWKPTGTLQSTLASVIERSGVGLHSGASTTARLLPAVAGDGRYFVLPSSDARDGIRIAARIENVVESPLCTTLCVGNARVRTVEHLLSALEASWVDNCRIEISGGEEIPLLDGSAKEWLEEIEQVGLSIANDSYGNAKDKLAPFVDEPIYMQRDDSFIAAFPSSKVRITCGIDFPEAKSIGCQWYSCFLDRSVYSKEIAPSRTFCIYEEVEKMHKAGLVKGGTLENAIVCSVTSGWLNQTLRFPDEPCRHKILDLLGDFSLLAQNGNQGLPMAHLIAYKAGHSLHAEFVRKISRCS